MAKCCIVGCNAEEYETPNYPKDGKCVFHAEIKDPQDFRNALAAQIHKWRRQKATIWDFSGWFFVDLARVKRDGSKKYNMFQGAVFPCDVVAQHSRFLNYACFGNARFEGCADFSDATFSEVAYFSGAEFHQRAQFRDVEFDRAVYYNKAVFQKRVGYEGSRFRGYTNFIDTRFHGPVSLEGVTFFRRVTFHRTQFADNISMAYASFYVLGDFDRCTFPGKVRLIWPGEGTKNDESGQQVRRGNVRFREAVIPPGCCLDFRQNTMDDDCVLSFVDFNTETMSRVLLQGVNCYKVRFYGNDWQTIGSRAVVGDELLARQNLEAKLQRRQRWIRIALIYMQLAKRFREDSDHDLANDFDRGVFEMRRMDGRQNGGIRGLLNYILISIYKMASDYSGSIARPLVWLFAVTAFSAIMFQKWLYCSEISLGDPHWPKDGTAAALRMLGLSRTWLVEAAQSNQHELAIYCVGIFQIASTAVLITLLVFSVRRRFTH